jgi:hypothetical protein
VIASLDADLEQVLARREPPYRSRGEAQVGRLLDRYGIPFAHELPTMVYDRGRYRVWRPDFTLYTLNGLILEYAGMMDKPDYAAGIRHKQEAYATNNLPAVFIYPADLRGPGWPGHVLARIQGAVGRPYRGSAASSGRQLTFVFSGYK